MSIKSRVADDGENISLTGDNLFQFFDADITSGDDESDVLVFKSLPLFEEGGNREGRSPLDHLMMFF